MRSWLALIIIVALTSPLAAQSFPLNAVNPAGDEFPGGRGAEQMVIYTPEINRDSTGTNEWGSEAVVDGGIVVSVGTNNSPIPPRGFVVSGHGAARDWINENLTPGTAVTHDETEVRIDDSPGGQFLSLRWRSVACRERLADLSHRGAHEDSVSIMEQQLEELDTMLLLGDASWLPQVTELLESIEESLWQMDLSLMASPVGEVRAVWHRVAQSTPEEISALIAALDAARFNVFLPETIYGSQAIHLDPTGLFPLFERFAGHDALAQIIEECHARGIEVHAWVHCFYIGIPGNPEEPPLLAQSHPEWLQQDREGNQQSVDEPDYMFINPAMPEVREALIAAYVALAENYDLDGFQFDYIRYPNHQTWERQWDYSDYTRNRVREELGFDPMEITPDADPERWSEWLAWRERIITSFVEDAVGALRAVNPELRITSAVFPDIDRAIEVKGQNWAEWQERGLMDSIMPMAYTTDPRDVRTAVEELAEIVGTESPIVIGLGPYLGLSPQQIVEQILASRQAGATGEALFCWDRLTPDSRRALATGPWRVGGPASWSVRSMAGHQNPESAQTP